MVRKEFFRERNPSEIENLKIEETGEQEGLVERIMGLGGSEGIILKSSLTPQRFFGNNGNSAEASRKNLKHGEYLRLNQPYNLRQALEKKMIPLQYRRESLRQLEGVPEEDINVVGFSFMPIIGNDKRKRKISFYATPEGIRLFTYSENINKKGAIADSGIQVMPYDDAKRISREGGQIVCQVPSREKGKKRYKLRLENFPLVETTNKRKNPKAIIWGLKAEYTLMPEHKFWTFGYTRENERKNSYSIMVQPQEIAAYIKAAGEYWKNERNDIPMRMNPFPLPSEEQAEFYRKLNNNVIVYDSTLNSKKKLRKLHLDEKSIMLARQISILGHYRTVFWDFFHRDSKFKDYDWSTP